MCQGHCPLNLSHGRPWQQTFTIQRPWPEGSIPLQSPCPPRPSRGSGSRLARLGFTFPTELKALGTRPFLLKAATVVTSRHGVPKPQHSEQLPEQAGGFQNPACPAQPSPAHLLEMFCPSAVLWKMFPLPKTSSLEQDHRTTSQTTIESQSSWQNGDGKPLLAKEPILTSKAQRMPNQANSVANIPC